MNTILHNEFNSKIVASGADGSRTADRKDVVLFYSAIYIYPDPVYSRMKSFASFARNTNFAFIREIHEIRMN